MKHDGRSVETFIVYPESKDKKPVVLVIHEIFGMSDWVEDLADQVAAAGYIAVAPDLLSGMAPHGRRTSDLAQDKVTDALRRRWDKPVRAQRYDEWTGSLAWRRVRCEQSTCGIWSAGRRGDADRHCGRWEWMRSIWGRNRSF